MGLVTTVTGGLIVWIVLWAISGKGLDAFLVSMVIFLVGVTLRIVSGYLPGRRS